MHSQAAEAKAKAEEEELKKVKAEEAKVSFTSFNNSFLDFYVQAT
jgi:hypothetical protein